MRLRLPGKRADVILALILLAVCAIVYRETLSLEESPYEPMGPAFLPRALAVIIGFFATVLLAKALISRSGAGGQPPSAELPRQPEDYVTRPFLAVWSMWLTVLYVASMQFGLMGFSFATVAYIVFLGALLTGMRLKAVPIFVAVACIMGLGGFYIFTRIFTVDLP